MTDINKLLEMKLHESTTIEITSEAGVLKLTIIRVAHGWIYTRKGQPGTFVPEPQRMEEIAVAEPLTFKMNFGMDAAIRESILQSEINSPTLSDERGAAILRNIMVKLNKPAFTQQELWNAWLDGCMVGKNEGESNPEIVVKHFHAYIKHNYNITV